MIMPKNEARVAGDEGNNSKSKTSVKFKTRVVSTRNYTAAVRK